MIIIYALFNSVTSSVFRYIGQTSYTAEERLHSHLYQALRTNKRSHKCDWIRKVVSEGQSIGVAVLAYASTNEEADSLEKRYIQEFRSSLTNNADGGRTNRGCKHTEQARKNNSDAQKRLGHVGWKHTIEARQKMSAALKGKKFTDERRAHISVSKLGKGIAPCSEERREKVRLANTGKQRSYMAELNKARVWTDEMRAKHSNSQKLRREREANLLK